MTDAFLTVEQAARRLQVTPYTLRDWLKTGRLQGVKIGRLWRVPQSALDQLGFNQSNLDGALRNESADAARQLERFDEFLAFAAQATSGAPSLAKDAVERAYREREDEQA